MHMTRILFWPFVRAVSACPVVLAWSAWRLFWTRHILRRRLVNAMPSDAVFFGVNPVDEASLQLEADESSAGRLMLPLTYKLTGPWEAVFCLGKVLQSEVETFRALLSPVSAVSIEGSAALKVGVPPQAKSFAFSYPFPLSAAQQQQLLESVGHLKLSHTPAWLEFVLNGGFCYFDAHMQLVGCNALGLEQRGPTSLSLVGPYEVEARAAGEALRAAGRLRVITVESLRASGFHSFGWVFKGEQPGGASLGPHHEQGAFVYGHNDGGFYYYQLYLPEQAKLLSALAALTGPMLQLNNAMVASVTTAKVRLHHLKEGVERLRAEDQRLMRDAQALSMAEIGATGVWARTHELRLRLLSLASMALGLLVAAALLWLAPLSSAEEHLLGMSAFRMLSSLIWFGLLTLFVWRILADCSAEGLSRQQRLLAGRLLVFVPLLSTLSECITLLAGSIAAASIVPKAIATMLLFVLTPELVFLARRRSALSTISRHEAKQASVVAKLAAASHEHEAERILARVVADERSRHEAAVKLQSAARRRMLQQRAKERLALRKRQLIGISYPILLALILMVIGDIAVEQATSLPGWLRGWSWLLLLLPAVGVLADNRRGGMSRRLRAGLAFSMTHALFYAGYLLHLLFQLPRWVLWLWKALEGLPIVANLCYFSTFILIHQFAQKTLALATFTNFFPHLLFPLHFFDLSLYYALVAAPLYTSEPLGSTFLLSAFLLQLNIVLKNSGTYEGLASQLRHNVLKVPRDQSDDAILRLQFLARLAIQYDLADVSAMISVPTMLSLFAARDGYVTLEGSGILILTCDLPQLWLHFLLLLCIKPLSFFVARKILERKMARALLGKRTIHGTSALAEGFIRSENERWERKQRALGQRLAMQRQPSKPGHTLGLLRSRGSGGLGGRVASKPAPPVPTKRPNPPRRLGGPPLPQAQERAPRSPQEQAGGAPSGDAPATSHEHTSSQTALRPPHQLTIEDGHRLDEMVISQVGDALGLSEERKNVLSTEFTVANLNYSSLFTKIILRSYRYFGACVLLGLFAVLPRHVSVPVQSDAHSHTLHHLNHSSASDGQAYVIPAWAAWLHMPAALELAFDEAARDAYVYALRDDGSSLERLSCLRAAFLGL